ncbi:MAG: hypothetical protein H0W39_00055 [Sphingomonas sp.]|nr:hypothetical protein [Sphingomonas sp.]
MKSRHRRQQQLVDQFMERLAWVRLGKEQASAMKGRSGDRLVIAFGVAVHSPNACIVAPDDVAQLRVKVDVWTSEKQVGGSREMGFVGPVRSWKCSRQKPFADPLDLGIGMEQAW